MADLAHSAPPVQRRLRHQIAFGAPPSATMVFLWIAGATLALLVFKLVAF